MSQDHSFDFDDTTFERVEVAGGILLANAEVDYGELFTEVIWDGLITAEKRARLDRAAEVFGLDRDRVRRIEQGLSAAYEARHRMRVEEEAPPSGTGVPFAGMAESPDAFEPPAAAFRPTQPPPHLRSSLPSAPAVAPLPPVPIAAPPIAPPAPAPPIAAPPPAPPIEAPAPAAAGSSSDPWNEAGWSEPRAATPSHQGAPYPPVASPHEGPTPTGGFVVPPPRLADVTWEEAARAAPPTEPRREVASPAPSAWAEPPPPPPAEWPAPPPPIPEAPPPPRMPSWPETERTEVHARSSATDEAFPSSPPPMMRPASPAPPPPHPVDRGSDRAWAASQPAAPAPSAPPATAGEPPTPVGGFLAPISIAPLGAEVRAGLEESRPSFSPFAPALDEPHLYALQRRIAFLESQNQQLSARNGELESRVGELEREIDHARRGSIDVDVSLASDEYAARSAGDPESLHRAVAEHPRDPERARALFRALKRASDADRRWCTAQVLQQLDPNTSDEERAAFEQHRFDGLIKPARSLTQETWRTLLFHPDEDPLCGDIFSAIVPAVLLTRAATQRRERNAPVLDPARRVEPGGSTIQAVRCVAWAAAILGMEPPPIYVEPDWPGLFETVVAVPPATRLGRSALSGRSASELAFAAGRHLSWYRHEHVIVKLTGSTRELEELFLAAFTIGNPGLPIVADVKGRVEPVARAIEPLLEPPSVARLRSHVFAFIEQGGRTHLRRWAMAADRTAARAGLLLSNDLAAAKAMLELEDARRAPALYDDLLVFATSDRYNELRHRIGIAVT